MILETIFAQLKVIAETIALLLASIGLMGGTELILEEPISIEKPKPEPVCEECIPLDQFQEAATKIGYILEKGEKDLRYNELKTKGFKKIWLQTENAIYLKK